MAGLRLRRCVHLHHHPHLPPGWQVGVGNKGLQGLQGRFVVPYLLLQCIDVGAHTCRAAVACCCPQVRVTTRGEADRRLKELGKQLRREAEKRSKEKQLREAQARAAQVGAAVGSGAAAGMLAQLAAPIYSLHFEVVLHTLAQRWWLAQHDNTAFCSTGPHVLKV